MQSNKNEENIDEKHRLKRKVNSNKDEAINIKKPASSSASTEKKNIKERLQCDENKQIMRVN